MLVLTKDKCHECDGCGVITHPTWTSFYEADSQKKKETGEYHTQEECEEWFRKNGYSKLPPEEPKCLECNGTGEHEKWLPIQKVLELSKINLDTGII